MGIGQNQPDKDPLEELRTFFNGRTIGIDPPYIGIQGQLYWKGPDEDDLPRYLTDKELHELNQLVNSLQTR